MRIEYTSLSCPVIVRPGAEINIVVAGAEAQSSIERGCPINGATPFFVPFNSVAFSQVKNSASLQRVRTRKVARRHSIIHTHTRTPIGSHTPHNKQTYNDVIVTDKQVHSNMVVLSTGLLATYCA